MAAEERPLSHASVIELPERIYLCTVIRNGRPCASVLSFVVVGGEATGQGVYTPGPGRKPWCYKCGAKEGGRAYHIVLSE